ncbi:Protein CutA [Liparis tanakae]|uniref:Protein CutA n=1 Tax=Liparis tanakae TaxID=230148 RepID=A0A4Z2E047_9TELE|nr:Protein CutA [Liparis tanakae]
MLTRPFNAPDPLQLSALCVSLYPGLWAVGVRLHAALTGSYVPGRHSVLLINSPTEQAARDMGRYSDSYRHRFIGHPKRSTMNMLSLVLFGL